MERKQLAGALCLLLAASAVAAAARPGAALQGELVMTQPPPETKEELRAYFGKHYREASCSTIYADLDHDGTEELLVMELSEDQWGRPILIHDGAVDPGCFTEGTVTVLGAEETGVAPLAEFVCSAKEPGGLYLTQWKEQAYLLRYAAAYGGTEFDMELFSLDGSGQPVYALQERMRPSDAMASELLPLLQQGRVILAYGAAPDGTDGFSYLDELFTTYED